MTVIVYLIGKAGVGKYTIAQELSKSGFKIADNQLINNPIFELLGHEGLCQIPFFAWKAIDRIRNAVFSFISKELHDNYVLTNWLMETSQDHKLYNKVKKLAAKRRSLFIPVRLTISKEENEKRIANSERKQRYKCLSISKLHDYPLIRIRDKNLLEIDISSISASTSAQRIVDFIKNISAKK